MFATKYREKHMRDFEREAAEERRRAMHRLIGTEGFARIDTNCPSCLNVALQAQCGYCNGSCHQDQHCPIQYAQMPSEPPQPYVELHDRRRKPSLWQKLKDWWIGDEP